MQAVEWRAPHRVAVRHHPDPEILDPGDAIIEIEATGICGSDLHLYAHGASMGMLPGDVLGHEGVGRIVAKGPNVPLPLDTRVAVPFAIACGHCYFCDRGLQSQCETTQSIGGRKGAALFGYTHLYGGVDGAQATLMRVPFADYGLIDATGIAPSSAVLLADVLPTAWQAVEYSELVPGESVLILGLGPIGHMCARIARFRKAGRVLGWDPDKHRRELARKEGVEVLAIEASSDIVDAVRQVSHGRGADRVIDAVGMDATGSTVDRWLARLKITPDRLTAFHSALGSVRRGGTVSVAGVYMGWFPIFPLGDLFDRQVSVRWGQANVHRYSSMLAEMLRESDPLGAGSFVSHAAPLNAAGEWYRRFRDKDPEAFKVVLIP